MNFVQELKSLQDRLQLEEKALKGALNWASSEEFGIDTEIVKKFEFSLKFHKLCFKHRELDNPYLETTLEINYLGDEVGYYSLFSSLMASL